jgi:hypothetical protein
MLTLRRSTVILIEEPLTTGSEVSPIFEEIIRNSYRGFIPDYDNLTPLESELLSVLWDRFNASSFEGNGTLCVIAGSLATTLICPGLFVYGRLPTEDPNLYSVPFFFILDVTGRKE